MPLTSTFAEYETDDGKTIIIKLNYEEDVTTRLSTGGFTAITTGCKIALPRKRLKPRYIDILKADKVQRIYYKTHAKWKTDTKNKDNLKVCGECISCGALSLLYN